MARLAAIARSQPTAAPAQSDGIGADLVSLRLAAVALDVTVVSANQRQLEDNCHELGELCRKTMNLSRRLDRGGADDLFYDVCFLVRVRLAEERRMLALDSCTKERTGVRLRRTRAELHRALALLADAFASATWTPVRIPRRSEVSPKPTPNDPVDDLAAVLLSATSASANDTVWVLDVGEIELALVESHPAFTTVPAHLAEMLSAQRVAITSWARGERPPELGRLLHQRLLALVEALTG